ncbi:hypothetical protein [Clostridium cavendishii]|nr:hypothetical protein [Clostridium cavendishii]
MIIQWDARVLEKIVVDKEKAFSIKPEDLYYWHYEILEKVLSEI